MKVIDDIPAHKQTKPKLKLKQQYTSTVEYEEVILIHQTKQQQQGGGEGEDE